MAPRALSPDLFLQDCDRGPLLRGRTPSPKGDAIVVSPSGAGQAPRSQPSPCGRSPSFKRLLEVTASPKAWLQKLSSRRSFVGSFSVESVSALRGQEDRNFSLDDDDADFVSVEDVEMDDDDAVAAVALPTDDQQSDAPQNESQPQPGRQSGRRASLESGRSSHRRHSLQDVLASKPVLAAFEEHLVNEQAVESLDFINIVNEWNENYANMTVAARRARARLIYARFVSEDGSQAINISSKQRDALGNECLRHRPWGESIRPDVFDDAYHEVRTMMELDSIPRFIRSDSYAKIHHRRSASLPQVLPVFRFEN